METSNQLEAALAERQTPDDIDTILAKADAYEPGAIVPLHRGKRVRHEMTIEKPWHRTAAYLAAQGFNQRQIAHACDVSPAQVSLVAQQPWFRETVARLIAEFGLTDSARDILEAAASTAATNMVIMMSTAASESVKFNASKDVLDRVLGKADQNIVHKRGHVPTDPSEEIKAIEAEIELLKKEEDT